MTTVLWSQNVVRENILTSHVLVEYTLDMHSANVTNQLRAYCSFQMRFHKWLHLIFFFSLDPTKVNMHIIYLHCSINVDYDNAQKKPHDLWTIQSQVVWGSIGRMVFLKSNSQGCKIFYISAYNIIKNIAAKNESHFPYVTFEVHHVLVNTNMKYWIENKNKHQNKQQNEHCFIIEYNDIA